MPCGGRFLRREPVPIHLEPMTFQPTFRAGQNDWTKHATMHQDSAHRAYGLHWVRNVVARGAFLHAASLGLLGPSMPQPFRLKAPGAVPPGKGVNSIQLMLLDDDSSTDCMATRQLSRGNFKPSRLFVLTERASITRQYLRGAMGRSWTREQATPRRVKPLMALFGEGLKSPCGGFAAIEYGSACR